MGKKKERQDKYVQALVSGVPGKQAAIMAGYSETTQPSTLDRGIAIQEKIRLALSAKGMDEVYLAQKYSEGIEIGLKDGAREKDLGGVAQMLKQLGYLMGHGKPNPTVAVQINNHAGSNSELDPGRAAELLAEVEAVLQVFKKDFGFSESSGVHEGRVVVADPDSRSGVDSPATEAKEVGGGSIEGPR